MNRIWKEIIRASVIGFALPALLLAIAIWAADRTQPQLQQGPSSTPPHTTHTTMPTTPDVQHLHIPVLTDGQAREMDLEEYLVGVLLAEVPAAFEMDALKAQAVAARTYALKVRSLGRHASDAVCTSYTCCQGYVSPDAYLAKGGSQANVERMRQAAYDTAGEVLLYDGELVMSTYFSCSGGSTEDAKAVWGADYPYLQAVVSPGEENAAYFADQKTFTIRQFQSALGVTLSGEPQSWFGETTYTAGGGVDTMYIGGVSYRGTTLRTLLGLRSTAFQVTVAGENIVFATKGYGHRVGLSQYGADAMAMTGSNYRQILSHYYRGTTLETYTV